MPAAYTHFSLAKKVLSRIPDPPRDESAKRLYFFGAQGADFCFFYRAFRTSELNFGRFLHNRGSYAFFRTMFLLAPGTPLASYALGYVCHYAADCIFHPYIYHLSGKSPVKHSRTEGALDFYFRKKDAENNCVSASEKDFNATLTAAETDPLYTLYAVAAAQAGRAPLLKGAFLKSISLFRAYTRFSARVFAKENAFAVNAEHRQWQYPQDPARQKNDGADELFACAEEESVALIAAFRHCLDVGKPPEKELFGKNFLSGL